MGLALFKKRSKPADKSAQSLSEDALARQWLNATIATYRPAIMQAWGLDLLSLVLLIGQMYGLSAMFAELLNAWHNNQLDTQYAAALAWLPYVVICLLLRCVLLAIKDCRLSQASLVLAYSVRRLLLSALAKLGSARGLIGSDGAIASYITQAPDDMMGYLRFNAQKLTAVSTPIILAIVIAFFNLTSSLILLATAPLVPIFMILIGVSTAKKSQEQMHALAQLGGRFLDWLRGMGTLTRLNAVNVASDDIAHSAEQYRMRTMSVLKIAFLNSAVLEFLSALAIALVAVYLGFGLMGILPWATNKVVVDYHSALFILLLVPEFYAPLRRLGADYHAKGQAMAAARVLTPFFEIPTEQTTSVPNDVHFDIYLDKLSVQTKGRMRLPPISLDIKAGDIWCIMGQSGVGKSTLLSVLLGFCDYQGSAKIGGHEVAAWDKLSLRHHIGFLSQTPALLPLTIAENLRLAKPSASDDELYDALKQVGLDSLIDALPNKLNTLLGERGGGLSGGQAQRLAIAQLILQDACIWLLDEPTEHLDASTKNAIHKLIYQLHQRSPKTIIWVSHEPVAYARLYQIVKSDERASDELLMPSIDAMVNRGLQ